MKKIDYEEIALKIDQDLTVYREDDFVYLLYPNPPKNSNILFQETDNALIVWSNDYKTKSMYEVFSIVYKVANEDLIFPYIESEDEYQAVLRLGGVPIPFEAEGCEDLCHEYGSLLLKKRV